jgi:hypothetical protein
MSASRPLPRRSSDFEQARVNAYMPTRRASPLVPSCRPESSRKDAATATLAAIARRACTSFALLSNLRGVRRRNSRAKGLAWQLYLGLAREVIS